MEEKESIAFILSSVFIDPPQAERKKIALEHHKWFLATFLPVRQAGCHQKVTNDLLELIHNS